MKKIQIEGINGSIELNKKYIYLILYYGEKPSEEHIIWFNEIEDIVYKKPTRFKYGFISLYLSTTSYITKKKKIYKIILDKIDEKSIDSIKTIYVFIKEVIENKNVKIFEAIEKPEKEDSFFKEDIIKVEDKQIPIIDTIKEIKNDGLERETKKEEKQETRVENKEVIENIEKVVEPLVETSHIIKEEPNTPKEEKPSIQIEEEPTISEEVFEPKEEEYSYVEIDSNEIEDKYDEELEAYEEEQEEKIEEHKSKSIEKLEKKTYELEKELQELAYKEIILSEYMYNTLDKKKIDKLIIELKILIEKIEKIKKEIKKQEKDINADEYIKLDSGNVVILDINKSLLDEVELNKYITQYKSIITSLDRIEKDTKNLSKNTEQKRNDIGLSDTDYERKINQFNNIKSNKEFISSLIKGVREDLGKVKWKIERTIEPSVKYKFVRKALSKQTKMLASVTALNSIRPKHSRLSMMALSFFSTLSAVHDFLGFDIKKVEYNEVVQKEFLEGLDYVDTSKTRALIDSSKEEIESILYECEKNYGNYPNFKSLRKQLISLKKDIDNQDKELSMLEEQIRDYNTGPKMKVLRHNQE